jgi:Flp pilus assembly secretin CpaC
MFEQRFFGVDDMMLNMTRHLMTVTIAVFLGTSAVIAAEGTIDVVLNQAKIVKLSRAADTIVIGNPSIADAAVKDSKTIVITGKYFGTTNFVVLDAKGNPIVDQQISVSRSVADTVNVYRQSSKQTLSCTPFCESAFKNDLEMQVESKAAQ